MWSSTVGFVNGKHRYLTAETFGFKISSNGQQLKRRQQWTIEPFPENTGPDGSVSSAASVSSQCPAPPVNLQQTQPIDPNDPCILNLGGPLMASSLSSIKSSSNGSTSSDQDVCGEEHENVAIKSHLNKYLAVDSFGNVTCDSDEKTESARFTITICSMSQGRSKEEHIFWAFKNVERGYYLGTTDDGMICCKAKMPKSRAELWHLHLLPARGASFFAIKSLGRKRFARVSTDNETKDISKQVQLDANISWGDATLFQFKYYEGGRYSLLTSDGRLLTNEGKSIDWKAEAESTLPPPECLFTLEYHSGYLAFRDSFSHYLAAAGRSSILSSRSIGVSRDELFVFESVPIQVSLKATFNNRWVSIKQGVDLSANQTETTSKFETFQLTYHKQTQIWSIMTHDCNFWTISHNTNTVCVCRPGDYEGLTRGQFRIIWSDSDATFSMKYVDLNREERWISARKSGQLFLGGGSHKPVKFIMRFQSRRLLNLRPIEGSGFVGLKSSTSKHLEANKSAPDSIAIEYSELPLNFANGTLTAAILMNQPNNVKKPENQQNVINVFNVRLNSTKIGQNVLDKIKDNHQYDTAKLLKEQKFIEPGCANGLLNNRDDENDCGIDANNNCTSPSCGKLDDNYVGGGVESSSAPSVASIINSFSNAKINGSNGQIALSEQQQNGSKPTAIRSVGSTVSKLASSFESSSQGAVAIVSTTSNRSSNLDSDGASVVTSCSSTSGGCPVSGDAVTTAINQQTSDNSQALLSNEESLAYQVAQSECCYMKVKANNKYLVVSDGGDFSIICDATNKACAQAWILELRTHNSIAIRASDNHAYMQMGTNGTIFLSRSNPEDATLWEF